MNSIAVRHCSKTTGRLLAYVLSIPEILCLKMGGLFAPPLAMLYRHMFERWEQFSYLQESIRYSVLALSATPNDHPRLAHYQQRLAVSLRDRYRRKGALWDLYLAVMLQKSALATAAPSDSNLGWHQQNLVVSYSDIYSRLGNLEDLNASLALERHVLSEIPENDPNRVWWMSSIGSTYDHLYSATGDPEHLQSGIRWAATAVENTPPTHPHFPNRQMILASLLSARSTAQNNTDDLDRAIQLNNAAVKAAKEGSLNRMMWSMTLASSYASRYYLLSNVDDLNMALQIALKVVATLPRANPRYGHLCHIVGQQLLRRYQRDHDTADLEQALHYAQTALKATPSGHRLYAVFGGQLAIVYAELYRRFGSSSDLETAIELSEAAVSTLPVGHTMLPLYQHTLSILYSSRHRQHNDTKLLERALYWARLAREKTPRTDPLFLECLHNITLLYHYKVQISRDTNDLDCATASMEEVIRNTPQDSRDLSARYSTMGMLYSTRYRYFGGWENRDASLKWNKAAVEAAEKLKDPDLPAMQHHLALQYFNRYIWLRNEGELRSALHLSLASTSNTPEGHFSGLQRYTTLGEIYAQLFALDHQEELEKLAFDAYHHASTFVTSNIDNQWQLAHKWAAFSDSIQSPESIAAYTYAFGILPTLLWLGTNITTRHEALVKYGVSNVAANALVACITHGNYEIAIEFLEQCLSITFNQLLDLQADLSQLEQQYPDLGGDLRRISSELRQLATITSEESEDNPKSISTTTSDRTRKLAMERDSLIKQVRALPDFEHFLLPTPFSQLRAAAAHGPVVMISCTSKRCDALIIMNPSASVLHLRLRRVDADILQTQYQRLKKVLTALGIHTRDLTDRAGRVVQKEKAAEQVVLDEVLHWLWTKVVSPIYDTLRDNGIIGGRLWWCPIGPLTYFPLHAVGPPNRFIPSYTSTLKGLIRGRDRKLELASGTKLMAVGISNCPDRKYTPLPSVIKEIDIIKENVGELQVSALVNKNATTGKVIAQLPDFKWLHLACHGQQGGTKDPLNSCLLLYDGNLYLKELLSLPLPGAEFVFLSACETAMGDTTMSNESLHLAGGMLFAGFKTAIATLWSINDEDGPTVARIVYKHLFATGGGRTAADAAEALQEAVNHLRAAGVPAHRWIPFIHIGV